MGHLSDEALAKAERPMTAPTTQDQGVPTVHSFSPRFILHRALPYADILMTFGQNTSHTKIS